MINLESIYEENFSRIYNFIFYKTLSKSISEELVSDVFIKVINKIDIFDERKSSIKTWIFKIANNTLIDHYKTKKVNISVDDEQFIHIADDIDLELNYIESESRKELYKALLMLSERDKMLISYKFFDEKTNSEISQITGINESTVSTIVLRALKKIEKIMEKNKS